MKEYLEEKICADKNIGLVHACAKKFVGKGIDYDDLVQAGSLGLVKAVKKFDSKKGNKFSTYAVPVILGEIKLLFRDGGSIKVSRSLKSLSLRISREVEAFSLKNSRDPSIKELSLIMNVDEETVLQAMESSTKPMSLTQDADSGGAQIDIPTEGSEEKIAERISLNQVIRELEKFERQLIVLRFFRKQTQNETARILGMSQVQVSRKERVILKKLKEKLI